MVTAASATSSPDVEITGCAGGGGGGKTLYATDVSTTTTCKASVMPTPSGAETFADYIFTVHAVP